MTKRIVKRHRNVSTTIQNPCVLTKKVTECFADNGLKLIVKHVESLRVEMHFILRCFILYSETRNTFYITFNVYENDLLDLFDIPNIHIFFQNIILWMRNISVNTGGVPATFVLCGHSLGSVLSLYLYFLLKTKHSTEINNQIYVFCSGQYIWIPSSQTELKTFYSIEQKDVHVFLACELSNLIICLWMLSLPKNLMTNVYFFIHITTIL